MCVCVGGGTRKGPRTQSIPPRWEVRQGKWVRGKMGQSRALHGYPSAQRCKYPEQMVSLPLTPLSFPGQPDLSPPQKTDCCGKEAGRKG